MRYNELHVKVFHYPENINISFTLKPSIYPVSLAFQALFFSFFVFDTESQYIAFTEMEVIV